MKKKGGHIPLGRGSPRKGGHKPQPAVGPRPHDRRRGPARGGERGPTACPMCGEVVSNLSGHIRSKHDDPASHPRD